MKLNDYRTALESLERSGSQTILSASFDLRPGTSGFETATGILREGLRSMPAASGLTEGALDDLQAALVDALETATASGAAGLFLAGPLASPAHSRMEVPVPPRHAIAIGPQADRFELERYAALRRPVVASAWADRSLLRGVLVRGDAEPVVAELQADTHYMERSTGRTSMHGRGGSVAQPAGGHGKTRIEQSAEEERERFAREAAALLERRVEGAAAVLLHGPPEFEARLLSELSPRVRERIVADRSMDHAPTVEELATEARERAVNEQYARAAELCRQVEDGGLGDLGLSGPRALITAARQGRLGTLVFDEDAVGHLGHAMDARVHQPTQDAARIRELLDAARQGSAACWFARSDVMGKGVGGAVGVLRW